MKISLAAVVLAVPFSVAGLQAQTTGVSRPEEIPITTSADGIAQPVVYQSAAPAGYKPTPAGVQLKTRAEVEAKPVLSASAAVPAVELGSAPGVVEERDAVESHDRDGFKLGILHHADEGRIVERVDGPANQLPVGTMLKVRLQKTLTTKTTRSGTEFACELAEPVLRDGRVFLPVGSILNGHVTEVHGGKRISGSASLHLQPTSVTLPDGTEYVMHGQVIDTDFYRTSKVDSEGTITRKDKPGRTLAVIGLTTGSGAAAGAVFGGLPGALIGGGIGAGVGTVMWLKKDRQEELPAETKIVFALTSPITFGK